MQVMQSYEHFGTGIKFPVQSPKPLIKLQDLIFFMHTLTKKGKSKRKKIPAGPYMKDHNWLMHMLRHLGTETAHPAKQRTSLGA